MKNYFRELFASIILILLFSLIGGCIYFFQEFVDSKKIKFSYILITGIYIFVSILLLVGTTIFKNKLYKIFTNVITFPLQVILGLSTLLIPLFTQAFCYSMYISISLAISALLYKFLAYFELIDSSQELKTYILITSTVFISVIFNFPLRKIVQKILSLITNQYSFAKKGNFNEITDYVISENNLRFLIYGAYVIFLLVSNIYKLQNETFSENINYDTAILQSFVTFIAFDRAYTILKQLDFKPTKLLSLILSSITSISSFESKDEDKV